MQLGLQNHFGGSHHSLCSRFDRHGTRHTELDGCVRHRVDKHKHIRRAASAYGDHRIYQPLRNHLNHAQCLKKLFRPFKRRSLESGFFTKSSKSRTDKCRCVGPQAPARRRWRFRLCLPRMQPPPKPTKTASRPDLAVVGRGTPGTGVSGWSHPGEDALLLWMEVAFPSPFPGLPPGS